MTMKILVTGANGFIGNYVVESLLGSSNSLKIFAVSQGSNNETTHKNLTWIKLDLHDYEATYSAFKETAPDILIHLAWYAEHGKFWASLENLKWISTTINLLRNFHECGGKKVFISGTCAEYDCSPSPCIEDITPIRPQTIYGKCKDLTRQIAKDLCCNWGVELIWGRIFIPYGPGEPPSKLIPSTLKAIRDKKILDTSLGNQIRDFIHISDVASAITHLSITDVREGIYNISSGSSISIRHVVEKCLSISTHKIKVNYGALPTDNSTCPTLIGSNLKLRNTDWAPKIDLQEGLNKYSLVEL